MKNVFWFICAFPVLLSAQTAALRGVIFDETGAVIPLAVVTAAGPGGERSATTGSNGAYILTGLRPGEYTIRASTPDLLLSKPAKISLDSGTTTLHLQLSLATVQQQITVTDADASTVTTEVAGNASATTLQGRDLDALSDDPEDLLADLQALAGPTAGGGTTFVDGFSGADLPTKESIREIRINQNPFSPEYDRIGLGRIEILTKPGAGKLRGSMAYNYMGDSWNARNPYATQKATLQLNELRGNLSGPLNRRASFTVDAARDAVDNGSIVNAVILDSRTLEPTPFSAVPTTRQRRFYVTPRVDHQLNANNTLTLRYSFLHSDIRDAGIGSFDMLSRAYRVLNTNQTVQATETAVWGTAVNETRVQFYRGANEVMPNIVSPTLVVLGSFSGGGAQFGQSFNTQNSYELQNYTTIVRGGHAVRFGVRARLQINDSIMPQNYNGTFTFTGGQAPALDANNQLIPGAPPIPIQSIERYRRTLLFQQIGYAPARVRELGGGASQFTLGAGFPAISGHQMDVGIFAGDDWKVRPDLTLSAGVRYEAQTNISDLRDWAPRIGLAWAPRGGNKKPKTVLRAGFGIFYDRFPLINTLTARRYDGTLQQQYLVTNPDFYPALPTPSLLSGLRSTQVTQAVDSGLRAPYVIQSMVSVERQLPAGTTVAVTFTSGRGVHALRTLPLNAPLPGSGAYPLGNPNPLFVMTSSGLGRYSQWITNVTSKVNRRFSMTGYYAWNRARGDTDGVTTLPANPHDFAGEYGPSATDIRHTVNAGGSIDMPWSIRLNPLLNLQSGAPFNITTGSDLYGTTLFNGRPGLALDSRGPGLIATRYGLLDPNPVPGEFILTRNYGRGPGQIMVNLRVTKTIGFGGDPKGKTSGERRYNLSIALSIRNLLNHTNPGPIIGNITSPLFGQANQMAGGAGGGFSENANNRRLELQTRFTF